MLSFVYKQCELIKYSQSIQRVTKFIISLNYDILIIMMYIYINVIKTIRRNYGCCLYLFTPWVRSNHIDCFCSLNA